MTYRRILFKKWLAAVCAILAVIFGLAAYFEKSSLSVFLVLAALMVLSVTGILLLIRSIKKDYRELE